MLLLIPENFKIGGEYLSHLINLTVTQNELKLVNYKCVSFKRTELHLFNHMQDIDFYLRVIAQLASEQQKRTDTAFFMYRAHLK